VIVGRGPELARIENLLDDIRAGRGGALVLLGAPGMGKTTLLDAAVARSTDLAIARAVGVQAERDLPYAGLHALLTPLLDRSGHTLSPTHREALAVALGLEKGAPPNRLVVAVATLELLSAQNGLLVLVDDLQWVDLPSAETLMFAARRLLADPVGILVAVRGDVGLDRASPAAGLPTLQLSGLEDASALLPRAHPHVAETLLRAAGGNPLVVLESAAALSDDEVEGVRALPRQLPPTDPEDAYTERLSELDPTGRIAARILALAGRAPEHVWRRALELASLGPSEAADVAQTGVCRIAGEVHWSHPLARSAAARGTPEELRAAHAVLAAAWTGSAAHLGAGSHAQADAKAGALTGRAVAARAWHLADAAQGLDDTAATALVATAEQAEAANASADAADCWERAAGLTSDQSRRLLFIENAARAALRAGATRRAGNLLDDALQHQPSSESAARMMRDRARIEHTLGTPQRALELFLQAVDLSRDTDLRVWAAAEGLYAAMYAARPDQVSRMAALVQAHHDPRRLPHRFLAAHARGAAAALNQKREEATAAMVEARGLFTDDLLRENPDLLLWAVNLDLFDRSEGPFAPVILETIEEMRSRGDLTWLPRVTRLAAIREMTRGEWSHAVGWLEEAELFSRVSGQQTQLAEALLQLGEIRALRGEAESALTLRREAEEIIRELGISWLDGTVAWIDALVALASAAPGDAVTTLRHAVAADAGLLPFLVDLVQPM
jgi:hypothetical protein